MSDAMLRTLGEISALDANGRHLDLACGRGELLVQWARAFGNQAVGVDVHAGLLADATARAAELGVSARVRFEQASAADHRAEPATFDVVSCLGATFVGDGLAGTLDLMRPGLAPDGVLMIGEVYWRRPPTPEALRARGCEPDEYTTLAGMLDRFRAAGLELVEMVLADEQAWDRYAAPRWRNLSRWLRANPDHPDHEGVAAYLEHTRTGYLTWLRDYLGWGVFVLAPAGTT